MPNLADVIETYLVELLQQAEQRSIVIQRSDLAALFACAPSQVSYVLQTRFIPQRGYLVETRRGGGGYIRITGLLPSVDELWRQALEISSFALTTNDARHLIGLLYQARLITAREARLLRVALERAVLRLEQPWHDEVRAELMQSMLATLMTSREE